LLPDLLHEVERTNPRQYAHYVSRLRTKPSAARSEPSPGEERASLERELSLHKRNLWRLQERKAKYGINVPLDVLNQIDDEEAEIARIESLLKDIGQ
jgi:hypothetical protein